MAYRVQNTVPPLKACPNDQVTCCTTKHGKSDWRDGAHYLKPPFLLGCSAKIDDCSAVFFLWVLPGSARVNWLGPEPEIP